MTQKAKEEALVDPLGEPGPEEKLDDEENVSRDLVALVGVPVRQRM